MKPAQVDISETCQYITDVLHSPSAASGYIALIDNTIQSLKNNPCRSPLVRNDYLASKGYRITLVKKHLIFYIVHDEIKTVSVMRVLYERRDWLRLLRADDDE
ncbi:MAG: type II toxin-antitoxin system RelE/ParE family toxin [Clostridiales Family XIII bacterium]|nr:type II toxin-antitoxin system RelE/ParE family toxin [Clostridiales Family XIII bacterium]